MNIKDLHWQVITAQDLLEELKVTQALIRAVRSEVESQDETDLDAVRFLLGRYEDTAIGKINDSLAALDRASDGLRKLSGKT